MPGLGRRENVVGRVEGVTYPEVVILRRVRSFSPVHERQLDESLRERVSNTAGDVGADRRDLVGVYLERRDEPVEPPELRPSLSVLNPTEGSHMNRPGP